MLCHADGTYARSAATVRRGERFVQIQMADIRTDKAGIKRQFGEIIWMEKEKRLIKHTFKTTEAEAETIRRKMKSLGIRNESAYMRAMALNGYILKLDLPQIREMLRLLRNMTNNLNQISKRLNAHGQMYETEIEEVQQKQNELWVMMRQLLSLLDRSE